MCYSRVGVLFPNTALGCGWDGHEVPLLQQAVYYDVDSANKIGVNSSPTPSATRVWAARKRSRSFTARWMRNIRRMSSSSRKSSTTAHGTRNPAARRGCWSNCASNTSLRVSLKRVPVQPGHDDLSPFTFLYLTGLDDFHWDAGAVAALKPLS